MADYYPLLSRAVTGLADAGPRARAAVYERARQALAAQLGSMDPPLSPERLAREHEGLEAAVARVEAEASLREPREAPSRPPRPRAEVAVGTPRDDGPADPPPLPDADETARAEPPRAPRPRAPAPPGERRGIGLRAALLAGGGVLVVGAVAALAIVSKDPPPPPEEVAAAAAAPVPDAKFGDRAGGPPAATAAPAAPPNDAARVAVAQRATFYEETPGNPGQPRATSGRVVWRVENLPAGAGQPLDTALRAEADFADAGTKLTLTLRRNRDAALPASHVMEIEAQTRGPAMREATPPYLKVDETQRGTPLAAVPVPVKDNLVLVGLSNLPADVARNLDLLTNRNWVEVQVRLADGRRGAFVFEKGMPGDRALLQAMDAWK